MSHQTSNVFDTVAENATNANDKFDNVGGNMDVRYLH